MRTLIAVLLLALAMPAFAGDTLDNKAVVEMVKLGLDQQIISAKIDASPNHFDTSPKALSSLKHAGVSSTLISKMIEASATVHTSGGNASHGSGGDFRFVDASGHASAMTPVRVTAELSHRKAWIPFHVGGPETFMFLKSHHAPLRTSTTPSFTTDMDPLTVRLVHLGQHKDRDARYVVFSGSTTDREVEVTTTDLGNGNYSIKPAKPLQAGEEYAYLVLSQMPAGYGFWAYVAQNAAAAKAYDFGVD
jgi:hypothetical protein